MPPAYYGGSVVMMVKDWLPILAGCSECNICGSENVYGIITPAPLEFTSNPFKEKNAQRGILFICVDCDALASIKAEKLES
jgi:hypothetical protein